MTRARTAVALAVYLAVAFLCFGVPVAAHPGRDWIGAGTDPQIFAWSFAWWPHAILHGQNPVITHAVWPPVGLDLMWISSIPGLAIALAPVTLLSSPVVAYNVATILMPALAAWTAYLLCAHITRSFWPSLAGGYLFGFSSYVLGHLEGHLHMSSVFLVPLAALFVVRYLEGSLGGRGLVVRLGPLLAAQLLLSTETLFTLTLALLVGLVLASATIRDLRPRLRSSVGPLAGAYLLAAVVTSPLLVYATMHFESESINDPEIFPADLMNIVVPTRLAALSTHWTRTTSAMFSGNSAENGAYLGLPLLVIFAWLAWSKRRTPAARFLAAAFVLGVIVELGVALRVRGASYLPMPWKVVADLPIFDNVLPVRFSMYVALVAAVAAAWWAASATPPRWVRIALIGLAIAAIAPRIGLDAWHGHPYRPGFFTEGLDELCLKPGERVLSLPYPSLNDALLWQAESGFRFVLADASLSPLVPEGIPERSTVYAIFGNSSPGGGGTDVVKLARAQGAETILVDWQQPEPWRTLLSGIGLHGKLLSGVYLYYLREDAVNRC